MNVLPPQAQRVFDDPTPLHATNDMFDPHADAGNPLILGALVQRERPTTWLFHRLCNPNIRHGKTLKAHILIQAAVGGQRILLLIRHRLIVPRPFIGRAEKTNLTIGRNQHQVFDGMLFALATVIESLLICVDWPVYRPFGSVMEKKVVPSSAGVGGASARPIVAVRAGSTPCVANA